MKTSRNAPCPCGSGKKYKACCMARDEARAHARSILGDDVFDQAEAEWLARARGEKEWAVDIAPAPAGIREDPDAALSLVMVTAGEWVAHAEVLSHRPVGGAERTRDIVAAVEAARRVLGTLPERLNVPDDSLVEPVSRALAPHGVAVFSGDSEQLFYAMNAALANLDPSPAQGQMCATLAWRETEATPDELRAFHEAAAAFFTAMPWAMEETAGPFLLDLPRDPEEKPMPELDLPERSRWAASVMGELGQSFGMVLHSQPADLVNLYASEDPAAAFSDALGFAITVEFTRKSELPRPMQREIAAAGWPIALPRAYPRLFGISLPARWIRAQDVRIATLALRAIAGFARGEDPLEAMGVEVTPWDPDAESESRVDWFHLPDGAVPITAEGPGADPEAAFRMWDTAERLAQAEEEAVERMERVSGWLRKQGLAEAEIDADLQNAQAWEGFVESLGSYGAVTESDLRLFIYHLYPRRLQPTQEAARALPRSMRRLVRWMEEDADVRYPFAAGVLDELERVEARGKALGEPLEETLRILSDDLVEYLDLRALISDFQLPDEEITTEMMQLREEVQRRWLLWHDELAREGMTDYDELADALLARQEEWENTPHPRVGGRTPLEVVAEERE